MTYSERDERRRATWRREKARQRARRRPVLIAPLGLTPAKAQALRVPAECPPALLAVLVEMVRQAALGQGGAPAP